MEQKDHILEAVKWLRENDAKYPRSLRYSRWLSPWDVDEARMNGAGVVMTVPAEVHGIEIVITSEEKKIKDKVVMDIGDYLTMQYFPEKDFRRLLEIYKVFGAKLVNIKDRDYEALNNYCMKQDERIVTIFWRCRLQKIDDVLNKIWLQLGGGTIEREDRLGRRVGYLVKLVEKYKRDKDETLLRKLGFIK